MLSHIQLILLYSIIIYNIQYMSNLSVLSELFYLSSIYLLLHNYNMKAITSAKTTNRIKATLQELNTKKAAQLNQPMPARKAKRSKKEEKKIQKMEDKLKKCNQLLKNHQYDVVIRQCKEIILAKQYLNLHAFEGMGNIESWRGYFIQGAMGWFHSLQGSEKQIMNVFDLLSVCFSLWIGRQQSRLQQCIEWYEDAFEAQARPEYFFGLGNLYYNNKDYVNAHQAYSKALLMDKTYSKAFEYLGWIYGYWFGYGSFGYQFARYAQESGPYSLTCQYLLALLQDQKHTKEILLWQIIKKEPQYYRVYLDISEVQGSRERKIQYINKCLEFDQKYIEAYVKLAQIERKSRNYVQASQTLIKAALWNPLQDDSLLYQMGRILQDENQFNEALAEYQRCLAINRNNLYANSAIARLYYNSQEIELATKFLQMQLISNPYDYKSVNQFGEYLLQLDMVESALKRFRQSISINEDYIEAHLNIIQILNQQGKQDQATSYLQKLLLKYPSNPEIYYGLAKQHLRMKKAAFAIEFCNRCINLGSDKYKEVYRILANAYILSKSYEKAFQYFLHYTFDKREFYTQEIYSQILVNIPSQNIEGLFQKFYNNSKNQFILIQIGKLALHMQLQKLAQKLFHRVYMKMGEKTLHCKIIEEIMRFVGTSSHINKKIGMQAYSDAISLMVSKKAFEREFTQLFAL